MKNAFEHILIKEKIILEKEPRKNQGNRAFINSLNKAKRKYLLTTSTVGFSESQVKFYM